MAGVLYIPAANAADDLTGAVLDSDAAAATVSTGLTNGTSYRALALSAPSAPFTPAAAVTRDGFDAASATPLIGYSGDASGKVWTRQDGSTGAAGTVEGGRARADGTNSGRLISWGTTAVGDGFAEGDRRRGSSSNWGSSGPALACRMSGANGAWVRLGDGLAYSLFTTIAGVNTQIGASVTLASLGLSAAFAAEGDVLSEYLSVVDEGADTRITFKANGVTVFDVANVDTAYLNGLTGMPGVRMFGGSGIALGVYPELVDFFGGAL